MHARAGGGDPEHFVGHGARVAAALREGEEALRRVQAQVPAEHERVLAELRTSAAYDRLPEREQARIYAEAVGSRPIARLLHRMRRGQFGPADLRGLLRTPRAAIEAAGALGPRESTGRDGEDG